MTLKRLVSIIVMVMVYALATSFVVSASPPSGIYQTIHDETFETVQGALHAETVYWSNHAESGVSTVNVIDGNKSLNYVFDASIGTFVTLGGTSVNAIVLKDDLYRVSMELKGDGVDFFSVKIEQSSTWDAYHSFHINPKTGNRLDDDGLPINLSEDESLSYSEETGVSSLSFVFKARPTHPSYIIFDAKVSDSDPLIVIDNVKIEKYTESLDFKTTVVDHFDNASGEIHLNSVFFLNDDEGTTGSFEDTPGIAIENRSLLFGIQKVGWDILGGTQGSELGIEGGHTYQVSFDLRLTNVSHFVVKAKKIADDTNIYEMYVNDQGQRLPGSIPITNVETVTVSDSIIHVSFEFSSLISDGIYLFFEAQSQAVGGIVAIDHFVVREEIVNLEQHSYGIFHEATFEGVPSGTDPLVHFGLTNGSTAKPYALTESTALRGDQSLVYDELTRFQWNELVKTDQVALRNNAFKFHMKAVFDGILNVKMSLTDAHGEIIHELFFNAVTLKRTQTYGKAYMDQGLLIENRGTLYIDYVFPELEDDLDHVWTLSVYPQVSDARVIIDDITFLVRKDAQLIDETLPAIPGLPENVSDPIPTGKDDAYMIGSMLSGSSTIALVVISSVSVMSLAAGVVGVWLVIKKVTIIAKKAVFASLIGLASLGLAFGTFFGCAKFDQSVEDVLDDASPNISDYQYVYPEKLSGNLNNPGMGWVTLEEPTYGGHPDMGTSGPLPEVSNVSLSTSWARIEVEEGVYDWTLMDQIIDYYVVRGKRINFRIVTDSLMLPNTYSGTPQWLFDKYDVAYEIHNYTDPGPVRTFRVVDTRNEDYQRHLSLFLEALADKYKDNTLIDVVEIRGWGNWGEWHSGFSYPTIENRMHALAEIIDAYVDAFKETNKLLVLSAAWDPYFMPYDSYDDYVTYSAFDYLWRLDNTTFRRDSGANLMNYPTDERLMSDAFRSGKRLPLLGEYSSGVEQAYSEAFGFDLMGGIDDILFKMRPNYSTVLGWVNANVARVVDDGNGSLWERGNEKLGYRLAVDLARFPNKAEQGTDMDILLSFSNSAVGRFWYTHPLKVSLMDQDNNEVFSYVEDNFDARTFVLGETTNIYTTMTIPASLASGDYTLAISIIDETGTPSIRLGMAGEIDDSMVYALGSVNIDTSNTTPDPVHESMSFDDAKAYPFKPKTTYAITFDYTPHFELENYHFADTNGYVFALMSAKGGDGATTGYHKWQDVSGEKGTKTIHVTTHDHDDYVLNIVSEGYDDIDIHDVKIEVINGYYEHFEDYDFTLIDALYLPVNSRNAYLTRTNNIKGSQSIEITSNSRGDSEGLKFDTNVYALEPNTNYTVSFQFESIALVGKGGYMFLNLIDELSDQRERIGEWYERNDRGVTTKTFNFTTGSSTKQTIAWGIKNGGAYVIDDIILTKNPTGTIVDGVDYGHPQNERPAIDLIGLGETEGFEAFSFNETAYDWGQFGWGQFTFDPRYVITGDSSLMGQIEPEALGNEWFEFARSKPEALDLQPNTTYEISFSYRIVKNPINNGFFYILMRDLGVGLPSDVGFNIIPNASQNDLMDIKTLTVQITTGNHENYQFIFGMHMLGEIVIDDVLIEEKP